MQIAFDSVSTYDAAWSNQEIVVPRSEPDGLVQVAAAEAIDHFGSAVAAGAALSINPSTLWRVAKTGRAIGRTREAVERWRKGAKTGNATHLSGQPPSTAELLATRRVLQTMVELIDNYVGGTGHPPAAKPRTVRNTED